MATEDFVKRAFVDDIDMSEVETFCQQEQITPAAFMDGFARRVVQGYAEGHFTWLSCNAAMNRLFVLFHKHDRFYGYAWDAFLTFETGEFEQYGKSADEIVQPWLDELVSKYLEQ